MDTKEFDLWRGEKAKGLLFRRGRVIDPAGAWMPRAMSWLRTAGLRTSSRNWSFPPIGWRGSKRWTPPENGSSRDFWTCTFTCGNPGDEYKETIASGTRAAVAGGYTGVACMPNTNPVNDTAAVTQFILERARDRGACAVYPVGAVSKGLKGENMAEFGELREARSDRGYPTTAAPSPTASSCAGHWNIPAFSICPSSATRKTPPCLTADS